MSRRVLVELVRPYCRWLVRYPWVVVCVTIGAVVLLWTLGLYFYPPSYLASCFEDPTLGVEARGTEISAKSKAMRNLRRELDVGGDLRLMPNLTRGLWDERQLLDDGGNNVTEDGNLTDAQCAQNNIDLMNMKFVFERIEPEQNLLEPEHLQSICAIEEAHIRAYLSYACPAHSVSFYVAVLAETECGNISQPDVDAYFTVLKNCYDYYQKDLLRPSCNNRTCPEVPPMCYKHNAVYKSFHFLLDVEFRTSLMHDTVPVLKTTMMLLQDAYSKSVTQSFYKSQVENKYKDLRDGDVILSAMEINYTFETFIAYMIQDMGFFALALFLIIVIMYLYLSSAVMVLATFLNVLFSFWVGYFVYHVIFRFNFFPFTNVMAMILLIAIGADDIFIFYDSWEQAKKDIHMKAHRSVSERSCRDEFPCENDLDVNDKSSGIAQKVNSVTQEKSQFQELGETSSVKNICPSNGDACECDSYIAKDLDGNCQVENLNEIMEETFHHAIQSILITSITTGAAMFANFVSHITMIRCFGVFTMTCVLANFLLMVTWLPALMVLTERYTHRFTCPVQCAWWGRLRARASLHVHHFFSELLPRLVHTGARLFMVVFSLIGLLGVVVVFVAPRLQLPSITYFPMFTRDHPFEVFFRDMYERFEFSNPALAGGYGMELYFLWGIIPDDNGDHLNPLDSGHLKYDGDFESASQESQLWMIDICERLKNASFIDAEFTDVECTYGAYLSIMNKPCIAIRNYTQAECCENEIPVDRSIFESCLSYTVWANSITNVLDPTLGKHIFDKNNHAAAYFMKMSANRPFSPIYSVMDKFYAELDDWFSAESSSAPTSLQQGFFYGYFEWYDLQAHLASGTFISMGVSMAMALFFLLVTTGSVSMSLYAIGTIFLVICVTVALLVALGWELNVVESAIVTLAVGLSIDFVIHYGVAYLHSMSPSRSGRTAEAFSRVGMSVSMAALTTFCAGLALVPSRLIAYRQIGTFLMIVMAVSWLFATFFLQSINTLLGPTVGGSLDEDVVQAGDICQQQDPYKTQSARFEVSVYQHDPPAKCNEQDQLRECGMNRGEKATEVESTYL